MATHNSFTAFGDYLEAMANELPKESSKDVKKRAEEIVDTAKTLVPVSTGALRDSIHVEQDGNDYLAVADTDYAADVEYGTSSRPAVHYMHNAVIQSANN